ncbi:hypothetical protein BGZ61DRAFT_128272 [Ilyonectria robusta]|uniref:uncharacterized protein n=1 Tax=Ilyonectria robusta TaxID=1079257 RepID=UPI001E8E7F3C|nr:uncharacterized protein BGZ61DRAFT_128272 [Ilyonectria robusta]KAH8734703.1 hypothetical protein BGZ61DRAFT_128272 [Ilyonectria robusta]
MIHDQEQPPKPQAPALSVFSSPRPRLRGSRLVRDGNMTGLLPPCPRASSTSLLPPPHNKAGLIPTFLQQTPGPASSDDRKAPPTPRGVRKTQQKQRSPCLPSYDFCTARNLLARDGLGTATRNHRLVEKEKFFFLCPQSLLRCLQVQFDQGGRNHGCHRG